MLKSLANTISKMFAALPWRWGALGKREALRDESAPIYESLAMTDELREALFPTTPQMVSAIFDRPAPLERRQEFEAPATAPSQGGRPFPIIF